MIRIPDIFSSLPSVSQQRIVHVEVIEQKGDEVLLRVNQITTKAKSTQPVPPEFLALAEVSLDGETPSVKLTPLEWLGNDSRLLSHQEQSLLQRLTDQLTLWGEYTGEKLQLAYAMVKMGLPLQKKLFEQLSRFFTRYEPENLLWLFFSLKHGFPLTDETADFLRHITSWIHTALEDSSQKRENFFPEILRQSSIPTWILELFGSLPWARELFTAVRWEESLVLARRHSNKKLYQFLIDDNEMGRWHITVEWGQASISITITMDPAIWHQWSSSILEWVATSKKNWQNYTKTPLFVTARPWENPWAFFIDEENKPLRGLNLYA